MGVPTAQQFKIDSLANAIRSEQAHDISHAVNLLLVPGGDDVADEHSGTCCWSVGIDAHNENPAPAAGDRSVLGAASEPHGLQAGAEISPVHMALCQELIDDAVDCRGGNGERAATRTEHRHSGDSSLHDQQGAAFASRAEREVKADQAVDGAAASTMPGPARKGDDAHCSKRSTFVISDRENDLTRMQRGIGGRRDRQAVGLEAQDSDVGSGIPTCEGRLDDAPTRKHHLDALIAFKNFFSGDDDAGAPMDSACGPSGSAMNSNNASGGVFDELRSAIRKRDKRVDGVGHGKVSNECCLAEMWHSL